MLNSIFRTITELLDSKKAIYGFIAVIVASVLRLYFNLSVNGALLLVWPFGLLIAAQAHVDAAKAKSTSPDSGGDGSGSSDGKSGMLRALGRTLIELLGSKKAAYGFIAVIYASMLHLYFDVPIQDTLLLVWPFGLMIAAQAHVDAMKAKKGSPSNGTSSAGGPPSVAAVTPEKAQEKAP